MSLRPQAGRRLPSGPWSRLKPTSEDYLESYGLPSKGDTRLNDPKTQETYYRKITERYLRFCGSARTADELERRFAALSLSSIEKDNEREERNTNALDASKAQKPKKLEKTGAGTAGLPLKSSPSSMKVLQNATDPETQNKERAPVADASSSELHTVLFAMRKLRESLTATHRYDEFALRAYVFMTRAAILVKHYESYQPSLLYLLYTLHPRVPLPDTELREFATYLTLDLACRQRDFVEAFSIYERFVLKRDRRTNRLLLALIRDDWVEFWRICRTVDGHQRAILSYETSAMRKHALKCISKTYFTVERQYLERCTGDMTWDQLVESCGVGWELSGDGQKVTVRRAKAKPS